LRLERRIADKQILAHEVTAWQDHRNKHHAKADWQFTTANARVKLKRLYPQFECLGRLEIRNKGQAMEIGGTTFGTITIDGKTYEHDVIIRLSGEVVKRKKKLSKKYYGTSHVLSIDEAKFVFEKGCEQLILGSGQMGNVHLSPEAEAYFAKKGCRVVLQPTPEAIGVFNRSHAKKIGFFT
jgi:hypothetical protein